MKITLNSPGLHHLMYLYRETVGTLSGGQVTDLSCTSPIMIFPNQSRQSRPQRPCCRDKGWTEGWAGALCLSSSPQDSAVGTRGGRRDGRGPCACPPDHRIVLKGQWFD